MARLIDADALPAELFKHHVHDGEEPEPMLYYFDTIQVVNDAPTVDAAPVVHGHWIYKKYGWAECSECHHDFIGVYDLENSDNYCRHCGAKMDGERRESE